MNLAVVSYKGGVGKTTITSNLASHLAMLGTEVHAIDMDDQNALRLHFGVSPLEVSGIACEDSVDDWMGVSVNDDSGVFVYPHGKVGFLEGKGFKEKLREQPELLKGWMKESFKDAAVVLIDTPPGGDVLATQAICAADSLLVVLNPDGASFATIGIMEDLVLSIRPDLIENNRVVFVISNYDERRELDRSVLAVMKDRLEGMLSPVVIHYDAGLREALSMQKLMKDYDAASQVHEEFAELALWLSAKGLLTLAYKK